MLDPHGRWRKNYISCENIMSPVHEKTWQKKVLEPHDCEAWWSGPGVAGWHAVAFPTFGHRIQAQLRRWQEKNLLVLYFLFSFSIKGNGYIA